MRILDRYIFREILFPSLIALVALTFVAFLAFTREIGWLFELLVRQSASTSQVWAIAATILPNVLTFTIPMAVLVGILTGFGRMSSDSEAIAFRASGISMIRLLVPVMLLGVLAWGSNLALTMWIAPHQTARLRNLKYELIARQVSLEVTPRVFNESIPNYVLYVQNVSQQGFNWNGILLANTSEADQLNVTFAQSGTFMKDEEHHQFVLTLSNGNTHTVSPKAPEKYSYKKFETTQISMAMPEVAKQDKATITEKSTSDLWSGMQTGAATYDERVEFHKRLALPFACLVFTLAGLPLGVSTTRGSKSMGLILSLILMLVYYLAFIGGTRIASNAQFSPFLGAWLPNIAFAVLGGILIARSDREHENVLLAGLAAILRWFSDKRNAVRSTRQRFSSWTYSFTHHPKFFRLLDVYVLRGFWFFFALVLIVFVGLFIIVTLFELLPDIVKNRVETSIIVSYFMYLIPQILYYVIPLTALLAILINLGTLTKTNEMLAVKASAISLYRMAMPLLMMGLMISVGIYFLQEVLLPYANQRQDQYHDVIKGKAPQTYHDPKRKWMAGSDGSIYDYNYFDSNQNVFAGGISIFAFKPNTFELGEWTFANRAEWEGTSWKFEDGWIRRPGPDDTVDYQPFSTLQVHEFDHPDYFNKEVRTPDQMTYSDLKHYIADLQLSGFDVNGLTVDLYRKYSFPLVSFIMVIIGIPFAFTTGKKGAFYGIGLCVGVGIFYWSTFELFNKLGGINSLPPFIAAWFPNLIFGLGGVWMMLRVKT